MHPSIGLFWALDVHGDYNIILWPQKYRPTVCEFDPRAVQDWLDQSLDDNIDLIWCTWDAHHLVRSESNHARDEPRITIGHHVLSIEGDSNQLLTPPTVQCVEKLNDHVEHVLGGVALEHGDNDYVEVREITAVAGTQT
jgi:hypothetical protein